MKKLLIKISSVLVVTSSILAMTNSAQAVSVNGYWKSNGTYVAPHIRTSPDSSIYNNFSYWK